MIKIAGSLIINLLIVVLAWKTTLGRLIDHRGIDIPDLDLFAVLLNFLPEFEEVIPLLFFFWIINLIGCFLFSIYKTKTSAMIAAVGFGSFFPAGLIGLKGIREIFQKHEIKKFCHDNRTDASNAKRYYRTEKSLNFDESQRNEVIDLFQAVSPQPSQMP